ncbi:DUF3592 domain-containing protein [Marinifilum flexuosum]|uniref:DUF3592 domain-containing protein n=1 Tax=Marinifilum flexuosum TaxID=1117708 RepID=UPI0024913CF6|nr:DUF3592 domain-containing protein [Marinifilum flexuosum]
MKKSQNSLIAILVFSVVFIIGGWLFYKNISELVIEEVNVSKNWPNVQGKVMFADIKTSLSDDAKMYSLNLKYVYSVKGQSYTGTRISAIDASSSNQSRVKKVLEKYAVDTLVQVYYDPEFPSISMLEPGQNLFIYLVQYGPLVFCFIGFLMFLQFLKKLITIIFTLIISLRG